MLQFLQTLHIHSRKEGLMNPKKKVSRMETVGGLKYVEDGYVVHGTFLLKLLMQLQMKYQDRKKREVYQFLRFTSSTSNTIVKNKPKRTKGRRGQRD